MLATSSRTAVRQTLNASPALRQAVRASSVWANVQQGPPDAILGITEAFKADKHPEKINLGVGAYRDDQGKPYVLPSVKEAEQRVVKKNLDKEYAGITGVPDFTKAAAVLAYGPDSAPLKEGRIAITQSISGTGALRIGGAFLERFYPGDKTIYIPNPSWANHNAVFKDSGLKVEKYRYYNKDTIGLDFEGMVEDIKKMPKGSIVLLHACAHNPTGVDPTEEQWRALSDVVKENGHYPFFDMAYQGFAQGVDEDAWAVRECVRRGIACLVASSFSKIFSLYGERVGALAVHAPGADAARLLHPAGIVPATDQHLAPFLGHGGRHARLDGMGQRPKRIAVQIDHPFWQVEHGTGGGEIGGHRRQSSGGCLVETLEL